MENKKTFGDYIQQKRKEAGLTQKSFAEKLYVTESAVSKWERGLSYPDISLIKDICAVLGISERELLTASEDTQTRTNEKLAAKYLSLMRRVKWAQIIIYGLALLSCFICNLAIQHTLSWFFIVLAAVVLAASLTLLPVVVRERRGLATLGGFTVCLLLFLLVCNIYTGGSWFVMAAVAIVFGLCLIFLPFVLRGIWLPGPLAGHKALLCLAVDTLLLYLLIAMGSWHGGGAFFGRGLPLATFWLTLPWGMLLIIRYATMNRFFKTAACLGLSAAVFYLSNGFTALVLGNSAVGFGYSFNLTRWTPETLDGNLKVLTFGTVAFLALVFAVAGIFAALRKGPGQGAEGGR